jgi:hypothetical protein
MTWWICSVGILLGKVKYRISKFEYEPDTEVRVCGNIV